MELLDDLDAEAIIDRIAQSPGELKRLLTCRKCSGLQPRVRHF